VSFDPESTYAVEAKRRLEAVARHSRAKTASAPTP